MEAFEEAGDVGDEQVEDPSLGVHVDEDVLDERPGDTRCLWADPVRSHHLVVFVFDDVAVPDEEAGAVEGPLRRKIAELVAEG
jgi:hypothetical protein